MNEDFVSFELAKKLKEKGFDWRVDYAYDNDGECKYIITEYDVDYIPAPTISQVLKWLRKEKKIHIRPSVYHIGWDFDITTTEGERIYDSIGRYKSYEQAALAGIEYYLDNLI